MIREGKPIWKGDYWSLHITVMRETEDTTQPPLIILTVKLGERHITASVEHVDGSMMNPRAVLIGGS